MHHFTRLTAFFINLAARADLIAIIVEMIAIAVHREGTSKRCFNIKHKISCI